jgi:subfamily B ATP-binding cassette protein HlyB/CyaB
MARDQGIDGTPKLDSGLTSFVLLARFLGVPVSPDDIRHQLGKLGKPLDTTDLLRAAKRLELKARVIDTGWDRLPRTPLPAIAPMDDGRFLIVGGLSDGKLLIQEAHETTPRLIEREVFERQWSGRLLLLARRARLGQLDQRFGITWFIPAVVASLFLQILALVTPLFFQVVIDKVLVHRGVSTLDVLIVGLIACAVFETLLGGIRTYVFSHTTNRIDVELGARLFNHLLALPYAYFQARRVGDSVARVRELENIRNFLTGSALTLVIDLVFTFVFIAVMFIYSVWLTILVLAMLPLYAVISLIVTPIFRRRLNDKFRRGAENQAFLVESVTGIETIKAMAVEPQMQRRWEEQLAAYVTASFNVQTLANIGSQSVQFVSKLTTALILLFGAHAVIDGSLTVGELVAFNMLAGRVSAPVLRLAQMAIS